jgi:SEC-C motif-containing protein
MRSRYSAFALGLGPYLVKTLASTHPDKKQAFEPRGKQKFVGLRILHTQEDAHLGEVLFYARIYSDGMETSFAELSHFVREDGGWRYSKGVLVEKARLPKDIGALTKATFLELARR